MGFNLGDTAYLVTDMFKIENNSYNRKVIIQNVLIQSITHYLDGRVEYKFNKDMPFLTSCRDNEKLFKTRAEAETYAEELIEKYKKEDEERRAKRQQKEHDDAVKGAEYLLKVLADNKMHLDKESLIWLIENEYIGDVDV